MLGILSALLHHSFHDDGRDDIQFSRINKRLFILARLHAKTKTWHILVCKLLFVDKVALVSQREAGLQPLMDRFAAASVTLSRQISLCTGLDSKQRTNSATVDFA